MENDSPPIGLADRTPNKILRLLKTNGPSDAHELASQLGISDAAVRQHLYRLRDRNLVGSAEEARPLGRPAKLWNLTEKANQQFPDSHALLTESLMKSIESLYGNEGLDNVICQCARDQIARYRAKIGSIPSLKKRLELLVEIRNREGYMADVSESEDGSFLLIENHCPIASIAQIRSEVCNAELSVFRAALADNSSVEREEYLFEGARRCTFRVRERAGTKKDF
jgi:predicted ArsR family transcriptional regulator